MTDLQDQITSEMVFHLSMKDGLSETDNGKKWYRAAGTARGLLWAQNTLDDYDTDQAAETIRKEIETNVSAYKDGEAVIVATEKTSQTNMSLGFIYGLARACAILDGDAEPLGEKYGPESPKVL